MRALIKRVFERLVSGETAKGWRSCARPPRGGARPPARGRAHAAAAARFGAKLRNARVPRAADVGRDRDVAVAARDDGRARAQRRAAAGCRARAGSVRRQRRAMRALVARVLGRLVNSETAKGFGGWRRACAKMRDAEAAAAARRARRGRRTRSRGRRRRSARRCGSSAICSGACSRRGRAHARGERQQLVLARFGAAAARGACRALATWVEYGARRRYYRGLLARSGRRGGHLAAGWRTWRGRRGARRGRARGRAHAAVARARRQAAPRARAARCRRGSRPSRVAVAARDDGALPRARDAPLRDVGARALGGVRRRAARCALVARPRTDPARRIARLAWKGAALRRGRRGRARRARRARAGRAEARDGDGGRRAAAGRRAARGVRLVVRVRRAPAVDAAARRAAHVLAH